MAAAALSFGAADTLGGSGFLAVYLVGLAVGSTPSRYRRQLVAFHEGVAFVAQVGAVRRCSACSCSRTSSRTSPSPGSRSPSLLMLVARPAAVWASTAGSRLHATASGCCSAGPACAARCRSCSRRSCSPRTSRTANTIFNAVFFVVIVSTLVQGTTLEWVARRARADLAAAAGSRERAAETGPLAQLDLVEFEVATNHAINGSAVRELGLPRDALVAVIERDGDVDPAARKHRRRRPATGSSSSIPAAAAPDLEDVFTRWRRLI